MNIKQKIRAANVFQWEVAEKLGITEFHFSRLLRRPENLKPELIERIERAIEEVLSERREIK